MRLKPWVLTAGFGVLFAAIANLAWLTAIGTTGPWFNVSTSAQVYDNAILGGLILSLALVLVAGLRSNGMEIRLRALDRRIALVRGAERPSVAPLSNGPLDNDLDAEIDAALGEIDAPESSAVVRLEREGHDALVDLPSVLRTAPAGARTDLLRELVRERMELREAASVAWRIVAGPVVLSFLFVTIGGVMLPGSEGFAASHYQLNTTLVLFLGYAFAPLLAWAVLALGSLWRGPRHEIL